MKTNEIQMTLPAEPTPGYFQAAGEGLVLDPRTGLMWAAETLGDRMTWADAQQAVEQLTFGGFTDWRLPTVRELLSLVDYERHNPAIDKAHFPDTKSAYYWTSSPGASDPDVFAWIVYFYGGSADIHYRYNNAFVRAVRSVPASPAGQ